MLHTIECPECKSTAKCVDPSETSLKDLDESRSST
jgi:hypothetical protein